MTPKMQRRAAKFGSPFGRPPRETFSKQPSAGTSASPPEQNLEEIVSVSSETSPTSESVSKPETEGTQENPTFLKPIFTVHNMPCCGMMDVAGIHGAIPSPYYDKLFWREDYTNRKRACYRYPRLDEVFVLLHETIESQGKRFREASDRYAIASDAYNKNPDHTTLFRMHGDRATYDHAVRLRTVVTGAYFFTYTRSPKEFQNDLDNYLKETRIGKATHSDGFHNGNSGHTVYTTLVGLDMATYRGWAAKRGLNLSIIR